MFSLNKEGSEEKKFSHYVPDDEDEYSIVNEAQIQFFEPANDKTRYYKVRFQNYPTIFGKIETLVDKD